jgi:hypothetical protein
MHLVSPSTSYPILDLLGIDQEAAPAWLARIVSPEMQRWVADRWDADNFRLVWRESDPISVNPGIRDHTLPLADLPRLVALEMVASAAIDAAAGLKAYLSYARSLVKITRRAGASSLLHVPDSGLTYGARLVLRRWTGRLAIANADPTTEWDRDIVRLAVVKPNGPDGTTLRVGEITQPWLRDVCIRVLRIRLNDANNATMFAWCAATIRLSAFLRTRHDRGNNARVLTSTVMDQFVEAMRADPAVTDAKTEDVLKNVSSVLAQGRALGYTDRQGLPASFSVRSEHYPKTATIVTEDRGFPDSTFRFILGADDLFGPRVHDLARSVTSDEFTGDLFVTALHLAANFGRRPDELCRIGADRVRTRDDAAAELLYDNFKSGRDRVWLPIDARSAEIAGVWIDRLRQRYPDTPLTDLALFPAIQSNPGGTARLRTATLSLWWRKWLILLEQAIVIGHLHESTQASIADLCQMKIRDIVDGEIHAGAVPAALDARARQIVTDYASDVSTRLQGSRYCPDDTGDLPLFPDPFVRMGGRINMRERVTEVQCIDPVRFEPLGVGWTRIAAQYASGGIPGFSLGERRINSDLLQVRMFRHTYLQHLVNIGTEIFLVQELADHANVQVTIDAYVRVQDEKLREAVDALAEHRLNMLGQPLRRAQALPSLSLIGVGTNDCASPQVLALGKEGCEFDRMCFDCSYLVSDPSNMTEIKSEIHTCNLTLARLAAGPDTPLKPHHEAVLRARRDGWQRALSNLESHLAALDPVERERVDTAVQIVRAFRNRMRTGGINLGGKALPTLS